MEYVTFEKITTEQFLDRVVVPQADALVKVSSAWNGAGQMLCHTLRELADEYAGQIHFFSVEDDQDSTLRDNYMIETIPTILFFKKGTLVDKLPGLNNRDAIVNKINQIVNA